MKFGATVGSQSGDGYGSSPVEHDLGLRVDLVVEVVRERAVAVPDGEHRDERQHRKHAADEHGGRLHDERPRRPRRGADARRHAHVFPRGRHRREALLSHRPPFGSTSLTERSGLSTGRSRTCTECGSGATARRIFAVRRVPPTWRSDTLSRHGVPARAPADRAVRPPATETVDHAGSGLARLAVERPSLVVDDLADARRPHVGGRPAARRARDAEHVGPPRRARLLGPRPEHRRRRPPRRPRRARVRLGRGLPDRDRSRSGRSSRIGTSPTTRRSRSTRSSCRSRRSPRTSSRGSSSRGARRSSSRR